MRGVHETLVPPFFAAEPKISLSCFRLLKRSKREYLTAEAGVSFRVVHGVPRENFVSQRKTFGRDHQRDNHLRTIRALGAAVTVPAFVLRIF
jgi:hypothetical protein